MARAGRPKSPLVITSEERRELEALRDGAHASLGQRARIVLACATGASNRDVAHELGVSGATVGKWRRRFLDRRLPGLHDAPRPGAPKRISDQDVERVIQLTLKAPPVGAAAWSTRSLARTTGLSQTAISRIWRTFAVKPDLANRLAMGSESSDQPSPTDAPFPTLIRDVVGLYVTPREMVLAFFASRPPADGRIPPGLEKSDHTTGLRDLVAAAVADSESPSLPDFKGRLLRFVADLDRKAPRRIVVHLLLTRKRDQRLALVYQWAALRTRFRLHFSGPDRPWLETAENAMAAAASRRRADGSSGTHKLEEAITEVLGQGDLWPFAWLASDRFFEGQRL